MAGARHALGSPAASTPNPRAKVEMDDFTLHERLAADTFELARWDLSRVLLMNDANYVWVILVPQRPDLRELHDLQAPDLLRLSAEIVRASRTIQRLFEPHKMNVAALGNQVPQLHVHVIARTETDPAWPDPVWGKVPTRPYDDEARDQMVSALTDAFATVTAG